MEGQGKKFGRLEVVMTSENRWNYLVDGERYLLKKHAEWISSFSEGFSRYKKGELFGAVDGFRGKLALKRKMFASLRAMQEGFFCASLNKQSFFFIDAEGNRLGNEEFVSANSFSNGFAAVYRFNKRWNYLRKDGTMLFSDEEAISMATDFKGSVAAVKFKLPKGESFWTFIDSKGKQVDGLPKCAFVHELKRQNGFIITTAENNRNGGSNVVDENGKIVFPTYFARIDEDYYSGSFVAERFDGKWSLIDKRFNVLIDGAEQIDGFRYHDKFDEFFAKIVVDKTQLFVDPWGNLGETAEKVILNREIKELLNG